MLPYLCIKDAKEHLLATVKRMNVLKLQEKGLLLTYRQSCSTSWLELTFLDPTKSATGLLNDAEVGSHTDVIVVEEIEMPERVLLAAGASSSTNKNATHLFASVDRETMEST